MTRLLTRLRRDESGFTLVEVLMVSAMLTVILGAIAGLATTAERMAPRDNEGAQHLVDAQTGLDRMVRELRAAYNVVSVSSDVIEADIVQRRTGVPARIRFDCRIAHPSGGTLRRCVRQTVSGGTASGQEVLVDRVVNGAAGVNVFTPRVRDAADPADTRVHYVGVSVLVTADGGRKDGAKYRTMLEDGAYLRNVDVLR